MNTFRQALFLFSLLASGPAHAMSTLKEAAHTSPLLRIVLSTTSEKLSTTTFPKMALIISEKNTPQEKESWSSQAIVLASYVAIPIAILAASTVAHEAGHALIGTLCGAKLDHIKFSLLGATCYFSRGPTILPELIDLAGPVAGLAGAFTIQKLLLMIHNSLHGSITQSNFYESTGQQTLHTCINAATVFASIPNIFNLLPWKIQAHGRLIVSDGGYLAMNLASRWGKTFTPPNITEFVF